MASKSKLPVQLYVTAKLQPIYNDGKIIGHDTPLGFLNAYESGKSSFEKKKLTQDIWAYQNYMPSFKLEERGSKQHPEWWIVGSEYGEYVRGQNRPLLQVDRFADPQPQIWDNSPLNGFKVLNSVSRYSTANKLWRILDPRNIEFEISTACLETLIMEVGILKGGEIAGKCAWMSNKNLVAVP